MNRRKGAIMRKNKKRFDSHTNEGRLALLIAIFQSVICGLFNDNKRFSKSKSGCLHWGHIVNHKRLYF